MVAYLEHKHLSSQDGDGVKVALTDVGPLAGLLRDVGLGGARWRGRGAGLGS